MRLAADWRGVIHNVRCEGAVRSQTQGQRSVAFALLHSKDFVCFGKCKRAPPGRKRAGAQTRQERTQSSQKEGQSDPQHNGAA